MRAELEDMSKSSHGAAAGSLSVGGAATHVRSQNDAPPCVDIYHCGEIARQVSEHSAMTTPSSQAARLPATCCNEAGRLSRLKTVVARRIIPAAANYFCCAEKEYEKQCQGN